MHAAWKGYPSKGRTRYKVPKVKEGLDYRSSKQVSVVSHEECGGDTVEEFPGLENTDQYIQNSKNYMQDFAGF